MKNFVVHWFSEAQILGNADSEPKFPLMCGIPETLLFHEKSGMQTAWTDRFSKVEFSILLKKSQGVRRILMEKAGESRSSTLQKGWIHTNVKIALKENRRRSIEKKGESQTSQR